MKELAKTIDEPENQHESTYALLMRSEEKSRNLLEVLIYPFLIIGAIIAIWQFVLPWIQRQRFALPAQAGCIRPEDRYRGIQML